MSADSERCVWNTGCVRKGEIRTSAEGSFSSVAAPVAVVASATPSSVDDRTDVRNTWTIASRSDTSTVSSSAIPTWVRS